MSSEELEEIQGGYSWIKVNQFKEDNSVIWVDSRDKWKDSFKRLEEHHKKETEFLINKCRELAKVIQDYKKWNDD